MDSRARDALAVLAHVYLRFERPDEAAALLAALVAIDPKPRWARQALSLAQLRSGLTEAALSTAESLLTEALDDDERVPLLLLAAKAHWRLGNEVEAQRLRIAARAAATTSIVHPIGRLQA
ncbi:tetratricopeptide repeat protein [Hyphomicrobium sp. MC1]|uniref:type III secretion apparatus assembly chaperone SctY n=1 Tax=Hyphomicrobium sp. (strain MC1) TaxID=717785 RepID=UPI0002E13F42|nr:tetratricopeptide repeat protein [Hyphomicrobium sp. MC1]